MSGPQVYLTPPSFLPWIPANLPRTLPPPVGEHTLRSPFAINKDLFNAVLHPAVPLTIASAYLLAVIALNAYNKRRDHKPWWIAKQPAFQWFVVAHNVTLALYSAATFVAMFRAIAHTWPGFVGNPNGAAGVADALCKLHGPRGLGDATTFNTTINIWEAKNTLIKLGYDGNPDPTDVGRLWNEGLAFWGWFFYISKFYEVLDTFIVQAKGKRSQVLQTYHHAGAMLCMWAGIRYMSPPIWMFVFINSAIHAAMYTYYTLSALGYKVPNSVKRSLTTAQIAQIIFGASYAALHLFIAYDIPISTPYQIASTIQRAVSSVSSFVAEASTTVSEVIESPTTLATMGTLLKKLLLRAAGEEGLAERVRGKDAHGELLPPAPKLQEKIEQVYEQVYETRYRREWTKVNCIDTSGEAFAIYLNLLYLAPLAFLFIRFFVRAYTQRGKPHSVQQALKQTSDSGKEAEDKTQRLIEESAEKVEDELHKRGPEAASRVREDLDDLIQQVRKDVEDMKQGRLKGSRRVSDRVASFERQAKSLLEKGKEEGRKLVNGSGSGTPRKGGEEAVEEEPEKRNQQGEDQGLGLSKQDERPQGGDEEKSKSAGEQGEDDKPQEQEAKPSDKGEDVKQEEENAKPENDDENEQKDSMSQFGKGLQSQGDKPEDEKPADDKPEGGKPESDKPDQGHDDDSKGTKEGEKEEYVDVAKRGAGIDQDDKQGEHEDEDKENKPPQEASHDDSNESEEKQDANLAESQATRPGAEDDVEPSKKDGDEGREGEDTDAMGQSGSIIDMARERASDAVEGEEGEEK